LSRAGKISSCVNWLSAREKIGPVNEPLTSQSTCLFNRFAPLFGEVTIGRLTEQNPSLVPVLRRRTSYNSAVPTIVQSVENWYGSNVDRLKTEWMALSIRLQASADLVHGKVEIRAKSSSVAASFTLWNTGDVTVLRIDLPAKRDSVVDDRKIAASEDVGLLLDSYFRHFPFGGDVSPFSRCEAAFSKNSPKTSCSASRLKRLNG
jgi:hypothetical protein